MVTQRSKCEFMIVHSKYLKVGQMGGGGGAECCWAKWGEEESCGTKVEVCVNEHS